MGFAILVEANLVLPPLPTPPLFEGRATLKQALALFEFLRGNEKSNKKGARDKFSNLQISFFQT